MAGEKKILIPLGNDTPVNRHLLEILKIKVGDKFQVNDYLKIECTTDDCQNIYDEINKIEELKDQIIFITLPDKTFKATNVQAFSDFIKYLNTPGNSTPNLP